MGLPGGDFGAEVGEGLFLVDSGRSGSDGHGRGRTAACRRTR